jgi:hypothetical protein
MADRSCSVNAESAIKSPPQVDQTSQRILVFKTHFCR